MAFQANHTGGAVFLEDDAFPLDSSLCSQDYTNNIKFAAPADTFIVMLGGHAFSSTNAEPSNFSRYSPRNASGWNNSKLVAVSNAYGSYAFWASTDAMQALTATFLTDIAETGNIGTAQMSRRVHMPRFFTATSPDSSLHVAARRAGRPVFVAEPIAAGHLEGRSNSWRAWRRDISERIVTTRQSRVGKRHHTRQEPTTLPHIFFINLQSRPDRAAHLRAELQKIDYPDDKVHRVSAEWRSNGMLGCAISHVRALRAARRMQANTAIILEDDFTWREPPSTVKQTLVAALNESSWTTLLLACNGQLGPPDPQGYTVAVKECQTTSGYVVRGQRAVDELISVFEAVITDPSNENSFQSSRVPAHALDQAWKVLQTADSWRATVPLLGKQAAGYSDIKGTRVDYGGV
jgi:hypothetical protein